MPSKNLDKNNLQLIRHNTSLVKKLYPNINRARIQALKRADQTIQLLVRERRCDPA